MSYLGEFKPDPNLKKLLQEWKLEQYYDHFVQQRITMNILKILKTHHIEKLFKNSPVGDHINFEHKLEKWKFDLLIGAHTETKAYETQEQLGNGIREKNTEKNDDKSNPVKANNTSAQCGLPQWEHFEQNRLSSAGQSPIREQFAQPRSTVEAPHNSSMQSQDADIEEVLIPENLPIKIKEEPKDANRGAGAQSNNQKSKDAIVINTAHLVMPDNLNANDKSQSRISTGSPMIVNAAEGDSNSYEPSQNHFIIHELDSNAKPCSIPKASIRIQNTSSALSMPSPLNNSVSSFDVADSLSSDEEQLSLLYDNSKPNAQHPAQQSTMDQVMRMAQSMAAQQQQQHQYPTHATQQHSTHQFPQMQFQSAKYKHAIRTVQPRYDLGQILHESSGGQLILDYYDKNQILREEHRTALINLIARYIDSNGCVLSLSESNQLESQITEIFPSEKEEFYRSGKRGRLYNKVANMRRLYKKLKDPQESGNYDAQMIQSPSPSSNFGIKEEQQDYTEYTDQMIAEERSRVENREQQLEFWKKMQRTRLKHIQELPTVRQVLDKWQEYTTYNAVEYVKLDFHAKFPQATQFSQVFYTNLHRMEKLLITKVSTSSTGYKYLQQYKNCGTEAQHLLILWSLHILFPPTHSVSVDEMGIKRKKRFSILDSQNSLIRICPTTADFNTLMMSLNVTTPLIIIVGELAGEIDQIYVYFEGVRFPMENVVQAAEYCHQLYFLFNIDLPDESKLYHNFAELYFFNIGLQPKNTKIATQINELNIID